MREDIDLSILRAIGGKIVKTERGHQLSHFHLRLVMKIEEFSRYPFTRLVIDRHLNESEYNETMELLHILNERYTEEQEEGFVYYKPLLLHFAGMLCYKLPVEETMQALYEEGIYPELMEKLMRSKEEQ
ncbi:DUF1878 family protein [Halobacillus salinus]|uniref:DUF1878 family protein n=1 Tax=Halobacillus salinus TaxID=192814 RepID=A0A4Z0H4F1_9BACI|nr:DUF1878 family protein [Halobacillus salinus]